MKMIPRSLLMLACAAGLAMPAQAEWVPERPIEFVIQTSPGGGSDVMARLWVAIIQEMDLSPVPFTVVNMPGGVGAVTLTYLASQSGDNPYYLTSTLNSVVTTPLQQEIPVMYPSRDLTPIALMAIDPFFVWTRPDEIANWEDFAAKCKADRLTAAGTGARSEDEIQARLLERAAGCQEFRYVPVAGGGEVAAGVAGGHQDFNMNQPPDSMAYFPDRLIPILSFGAERFPAFPDAPTIHELEIGTEDLRTIMDLDTGLHQMRGIIGSPDMPEEAKAWYENVFRQVFESEKWQDFMKANAMVPSFKGPAEYKEWLAAFEDKSLAALRDIFQWEVRPDLKPRDGS